MRLKARIKLLEKNNKQARSKENEAKAGYRVVESGKGSGYFQFTSIGYQYAFFLELATLEQLQKDNLIDSLHDVCGKDMVAIAESRGFFKNSEGTWETQPDIEHALLSRFLEEDHRRLGNDPSWIAGLRERLESLKSLI